MLPIEDAETWVPLVMGVGISLVLVLLVLLLLMVRLALALLHLLVHLVVLLLLLILLALSELQLLVHLVVLAKLVLLRHGHIHRELRVSAAWIQYLRPFMLEFDTKASANVHVTIAQALCRQLYATERELQMQTRIRCAARWRNVAWKMMCCVHVCLRYLSKLNMRISM